MVSWMRAHIAVRMAAASGAVATKEPEGDTPAPLSAQFRMKLLQVGFLDLIACLFVAHARIDRSLPKMCAQRISAQSAPRRLESAAVALVCHCSNSFASHSLSIPLCW